ncbi:DEKNAAC104951 [Brettanomyces naardenensis]|uniref:fructose-2,6-bisphosphate 2-phosphatase n=1 Tax=Brettanomyces naardenensis TaxID=13370 RepID=A0A448YRZ2_BRENA|nr:DEKNAAC104951 [Brettanomyces naardenensis]
MVGLPARGKSFISQKVRRYLSWLSVPTQSFNQSSYRKKRAEALMRKDDDLFDPSNERAREARRLAHEDSIAAILEWFNTQEAGVAIYDGANINREIRKEIYTTLDEHGIQTLFLESFCNDESKVRANIMDINKTSPDYADKSAEFTVADLEKKINFYSEFYEPMDVEHEGDYTFIKLLNLSSDLLINRIQSYLQSRIVFYIVNLHVKPRYIWLSRHGESQYNLEGKIGGDADLSERGWKYARKLKDMVNEYIPNNENLQVWTSTLTRTQQTGSFLPYPKKTWKALDELDAGSCDGLTYDEIAEQFPGDFKARDDNKFEYRYPGGESYRDVITRLEPIIMELENQENVLVITHQAVLRCIYAYFMNVHQEDSPWMSIPLHTLIKLDIRAYDTIVTRIKADIPAVSTYKEKGTSKLGETKDNSKILAGTVISSTHPEVLASK